LNPLWNSNTKRISTSGKTGLAQAALQIVSQTNKLTAHMGLETAESLFYFGILTNGLEWYIVRYHKGMWRHSGVLRSVEMTKDGKLQLFPNGIHRIAKALLKIFLNSMELHRKLKIISSNNDGNYKDGGGDVMKRDRKESGDRKREDEDGENCRKSFSTAINDSFGNLSISTTTANDNSAKKNGMRTAMQDMTNLTAVPSNLTLKSVEAFNRRNLVASIRRRL
jgi:hypothetical protein